MSVDPLNFDLTGTVFPNVVGAYFDLTGFVFPVPFVPKPVNVTHRNDRAIEVTHHNDRAIPVTFRDDRSITVTHRGME